MEEFENISLHYDVLHAYRNERTPKWRSHITQNTLQFSIIIQYQSGARCGHWGLNFGMGLKLFKRLKNYLENIRALEHNSNIKVEENYVTA